MTRPQTVRPGRRTVLGALALGAASSLTGCGIRLQKGSPAVPGIAHQAPPPDQAALLRALASVRGLQVAATRADGLWAPKLDAAYGAAANRLTEVMASDGIRVPTASTTPPAAALSAAQLGAAIRAGLSPTAYDDAVHANSANTAMLAALLAFDAAGATVQGAAPAWGGEQVSGATAAALLPSVRTAVYGLEIIAARTPARARTLPSAAVVTMDAARSRLEPAAGPKGPPARLVYPLAVQPTTEDARTTLARDLLSDVVTACAAQVGSARGTRGDLLALVHLWSDATALGWRWGLPPEPFPGLIG
ncbi:hypothetical protein [Allobranchiibius huperziae]|uniref:DUF4439 domain-containing protein n=1 Tax=Allobranchiibius huperziae TaxID=1874116 RepID=A0A853DA99_9MICO|nr:hypothetical protein [Allobranchiibius huperziae]NYJ74172.1 hypothetical protein [Allobranchiibius huperziae]